jgi:MvdD pre-ATP grasp domain
LTILVHSYSQDLHAAAVCWGLGALDAEYLFWPAGTFPVAQTLTTHLALDRDRHSIAMNGKRYDLSTVKTVWNRRRGAPEVRSDLDPRDREYVTEQSQQHLNSFLDTLCPDALWVNSPEVAKSELEKIGQLRAARQVGLTIPPTLLSNDPDEIRSFFDDNGGDVVYKAYKLRAWTHEKPRAVFVNYTTPLSYEDLQDDDTLSVAPGIFQRRVERSFEVRVTVFGKEAIGARLDLEGGQIDWRRRQGTSDLRVSPWQMPEDVKTRCLDYMRLCDLAFCCFDFIVTPTGDYVFLEANQMGQFLWVEEKLAELPMLDTMCAFLMSGDRDFERENRPRRLRFGDYLDTLSTQPPLVRVGAA